jgi:membrane-associated phospholipid phosphatase
VPPLTGTDERVAPAPAPDAPSSPAERRRREAAIELVLGAALVGATAIGGLWYAARPASGTLDGKLLDVVTASRSRWFVDIVSLHHPWVIVTGAVIAAAVAIPQGWSRSLACLVGPPLALILCELAVKPAVGRTLGGALCYPSGSTVGAAALAAAAVLAVPARWRVLPAVIGAVYAIWMAVAVVALRWHYPTDAIAGLAFGVGIVVLVDGLSWVVFNRVGTGHDVRSGPGAFPPSG